MYQHSTRLLLYWLGVLAAFASFPGATTSGASAAGSAACTASTPSTASASASTPASEGSATGLVALWANLDILAKAEWLCRGWYLYG